MFNFSVTTLSCTLPNHLYLREPPNQNTPTLTNYNSPTINLVYFDWVTHLGSYVVWVAITSYFFTTNVTH